MADYQAERARDRTVTMLFRDRESAERAYGIFMSRGYSDYDISLLMTDETRDAHFAAGGRETELGDRALEGAGTAIGGTGGATLAAIAAIGTTMQLPGMGLLVTGPIAAGLAGAGGATGGIIGGIFGVLIGAGIPEEHAMQYDQGLREGGIVLMITTRSDEDADYIRAELQGGRVESVNVPVVGSGPIVDVVVTGDVSGKVTGGKFPDLANERGAERQDPPRTMGGVPRGRRRRAAPPSGPPVPEAAAQSVEGLQYKEISVWVGESEQEPELPLHVGEPYTLNFKVGAEQVKANLLHSPGSKIPETDIPEEGLETEWVITSKTVLLAPLSEGVSVTSGNVDDSTAWTAKFSLNIPRRGESQTLQLRITPQKTDDDAGLDILIFAKKNLYRQFLVELTVTMPIDVQLEANTSSVRKTGEVILSPAGELGLHAAHEWLTPPGTLSITVLKNGGAYVRGETGLGDVDTQTDWRAASQLVAGPIKNLRAAAESLCAKWDAYLNDVDQTDLPDRLSRAASDPDAFRFFDNASAAHRRVWDEEVAVSQELWDFAFYGYTLYQTIFPDDTELRVWLDSLSPGWRINVSWSDITGPAWVPHVPWGMMCRKPPPPAGQPIDASDFLGLRFRINYIAHDIKSPRSKALGASDQTYRANLLYWGTQSNDTAAAEAKWQQLQWAQWTNQVFIPQSPSEQNPRGALLRLLQNPSPSPMRFMYLFCHCEVGDGNEPVLRFGSKKQSGDLVRQIDLGLSPLADQPLVFVNACTSAAANPYVANELEQLFFRRGCRAYLGTEIYMPIPLASRFALIFCHYLYRKVDPDPISAGEAAFQARLFLWHQYKNIGGIFYTYVNQYELFMATEEELRTYVY